MKRLSIIFVCTAALLGVSAQSFAMFPLYHRWGGWDSAKQVGLVAFRSQSHALRCWEQKNEPQENELQEGEVIVAQIYAFSKEGNYSEFLYIRPTDVGNTTAQWQDENGTEGHFLNLIDAKVLGATQRKKSIERLACRQEIPRHFNPYKKY